MSANKSGRLETWVLTKALVSCIMNFVRENIGAWCNGNTWVSKTFVEGSSPSAPAMGALPEREGRFSYYSETRAEYISSNPSPYKCT